MVAPRFDVVSEPVRRGARTGAQGSVAYAVTVVLDRVLGAAWDYSMDGELFGACVLILTALGSVVHARVRP